MRLTYCGIPLYYAKTTHDSGDLRIMEYHVCKNTSRLDSRLTYYGTPLHTQIPEDSGDLHIMEYHYMYTKTRHRRCPSPQVS